MNEALAIPGDMIARRYRVQAVLGSGAMAQVYDVIDETTGEARALKRLLPDRVEGKFGALGLQREYDTLTRLSHPLIIRAFDYGVDGRLPFYTMERLTGESVAGLAPLPWKDAMSLVRDVASALALVHSRKLVHRDVSTRNVCRTDDGRAKLIDFGAMAPMGPVRDVVGTPPFLCPESLELRPLDARADLFSLGALAYCLLTGRHAYPARSIAELGETWLRAVPPPSSMVNGLPATLDALVMALLDLNPLVRPASAAEVFDRVTSIAELPPAEAPETARAYLVSPNLVARSYATRAFRRQLIRAERGRGGCLLIESPRGGGRSRFLSSVLLEAKLRGAVAISADAGRGSAAPFGVVRDLVRSLRESEPALVHDAATDPALARLLTAQAPSADEPPARGEAESFVPAIERATRLFLDATLHRSVVIGVDDFEDCDGPSAAVLHALSDSAPDRPLLVIAAAASDAPPGATERLRNAGASLVLSRLKASDTRELLSSVFGEVSQLDEVAEWVHGFSEGLPGSALELAQHLVDAGLARYAEGSWVLPARFEGKQLPRSVDEALDARVAALGAGARRVAQALSLFGEHDALPPSEYEAIVEQRDAADLFFHLNELVSASVLVDDGKSYAFANQPARAAVRRSIDAAELAALHRRIALAYAAGKEPVLAIAAHHHLKSGDPAEAFRLLVLELRDEADYLSRGIRFLRTPDGAETVDTLFLWARSERVAPADFAVVSRGMLQIASIGAPWLARHGPLILEGLRHDSGLSAWDEFAHVEDPVARVQACVVAAYARYGEAEDRDRRLDPATAIQHLATAAALLTGVYARGADDRSAAALWEIVSPLRFLSPALALVCKLVNLSVQALQGNHARELRVETVEETVGPVEGIDELSRAGIHLLSIYYLALEDTVHGQLLDDGRLAALDASASYAPLAWQARMLREYYRCNDAKAEFYRKRRDAALTGRLDVDGHLETSVLYEASAYGALGNLMALKRLLPTIEEHTRTRPGWRPHYQLAVGNYHHLRGDHARAVEEYERGLALEGTERHAGRVMLLIRLIRALVALGRADEARRRAQEALASYHDEPIFALYRDQLELGLAAAEAAVGEREAAVDRAKQCLARADARGDGGAVIVDLLVAAALVAHRAGDTALQEAITHRVGELAAKTQSTVLAKHHSQLLGMRTSTKFETVLSPVGVHSPESVHTLMAADIRSDLERCKGPAERARRALQFLLEQAGGRRGFLYLLRGSGLECAAAVPETEPPNSLDERAAEWLAAAFDSDGATSTASLDELSPPRAGSFAFIEVITSLDGESVLAGVAALEPSGRTLSGVPRDIMVAIGEELVRSGDATGRPLHTS